MTTYPVPVTQLNLYNEIAVSLYTCFSPESRHWFSSQEFIRRPIQALMEDSTCRIIFAELDDSLDAAQLSRRPR